MIYRVDPATGKASVFFDLNTVISQTDPDNTTPTTPAANSLGTSTGLVNWYSITFDPEGIFNGTPAMFVSSVDRSDPNKNIIFEIAPNGTLMGVFVQMTDGLSSQKFNLNPTAILIPPVQDQSFLSGLIAGSGISSTVGHVRRSLLQVEQLLARPGHQQLDAADRRQPDRPGPARRHHVLTNINTVDDRRGQHRADRRPDASNAYLRQPDLLGLHRLRHAGRPAGSRRRPATAASRAQRRRAA